MTGIIGHAFEPSSAKLLLRHLLNAFTKSASAPKKDVKWLRSSLATLFFIVKINIFCSDITDASAKTKTLELHL